MNMFMRANTIGIGRNRRSLVPALPGIELECPPHNKLCNLGQDNKGNNVHHGGLLYELETEARKCSSLCLAHSRCSVKVTIV